MIHSGVHRQQEAIEVLDGMVKLLGRVGAAVVTLLKPRGLLRVLGTADPSL